MLHPLPLPLSSCLGCIPPLIGLPSLRFYAVGSSLFLLSVCFCLCSLFYRDDVLCWLLLARPFLYAFHAHLRFPVDLVWFRLSCDHGWIRSGSVNVRKQQQQQQQQQLIEVVNTYDLGDVSHIQRIGCQTEKRFISHELIRYESSRGHKIDGTKPNQTGNSLGDKQGKQTEERGQESRQQRKSSR